MDRIKNDQSVGKFQTNVSERRTNLLTVKKKRTQNPDPLKARVAAARKF